MLKVSLLHQLHTIIIECNNKNNENLINYIMFNNFILYQLYILTSPGKNSKYRYQICTGVPIALWTIVRLRWRYVHHIYCDGLDINIQPLVYFWMWFKQLYKLFWYIYKNNLWNVVKVGPVVFKPISYKHNKHKCLALISCSFE